VAGRMVRSLHAKTAMTMVASGYSAGANRELALRATRNMDFEARRSKNSASSNSPAALGVQRVGFQSQAHCSTEPDRVANSSPWVRNLTASACGSVSFLVIDAFRSIRSTPFRPPVSSALRRRRRRARC
jgi:hypothetical protein